MVLNLAKSPISFKKTYDSTEERIKPVSNPHVRSHVVKREGTLTVVFKT